MRLIKSTCFLYIAALLTSAAGLSSSVNNMSYVADQQEERQNPRTIVRKMSDDEGEKFYFSYWGIIDYPFLENVTTNSSSSSSSSATTSKAVCDLRPPILKHTETDADSLLLAEEYSASKRALSVLWRRDFQCPTNTYSCSSIGQSESCCNDGDTCVIVQNTGLGVVGCCPTGEICGDTVGSCAEGYSSCPSRLGGGCCIPGYQCVTGGCAYVSTYTVTSQSTTFVSSSTISTAPTVPSSESTFSSSSSKSTSSTTSTSTSTSTSFSSTSSSSTMSTTVSPAPPVRPTTGSQTSSSEVSSCPTGFYACSAVYEGGCCRVGRNCDTTSCPATSSTTIIDNSGGGITIAVPTGSAATTAPSESGSCATGWFSCAASDGGGCCPSGYACGRSCTASDKGGAATATVVKEQPGAAGKRHAANGYVCGGVVLIALYLQW